MITLTRLTQLSLVSHELAGLIRQQEGRYSHLEVEFTREQAARVVALNDFHKHWPSLSREDLLRLHKRLERPFKTLPTMTYDIILSPRLKIQIIPRQYLAQIDVALGGKP